MRLAAMLCALPVGECEVIPAWSDGVPWMPWYSLCEMPTKTPMSVPRARSSTIPASSIASQAVSNNRRCCGSM